MDRLQGCDARPLDSWPANFPPPRTPTARKTADAASTADCSSGVWEAKKALPKAALAAVGSRKTPGPRSGARDLTAWVRASCVQGSCSIRPICRGSAGLHTDTSPRTGPISLLQRPADPRSSLIRKLVSKPLERCRCIVRCGSGSGKNRRDLSLIPRFRPLAAPPNALCKHFLAMRGSSYLQHLLSHS